jgi:hypothetical protein
VILIKIDFSGQIFEKQSTNKFHENPSSGSRVVPCGQTDGWTDMRKLIVAFRNFANALTKDKRQWTCGKYMKQSMRHGILRGWVKGVETKF